MTDINFALMEQLIRENHHRLKAVEDKISIGFERLLQHDYAQHADMKHIETRIADLELQVERLSRAQGLNESLDD